MSTKLQVHVGETLDDVGARAIEAWHRMDRGEAIDEKHVSFETWETMVRVLSPKRLEMLRHIQRKPNSIAVDLAAAVRG
jgi:predicted transcriptional regulator